ncbi:LOW QUALITY PROTEIN: hypothetical protein MAR_035881 [Mya arenaria]|uniref:Uncharacterized protein n=1 Tax=Mya arenaria TaxID=6604 RepID=A0ABY7ELE4_MYAAR|nr:LOW QUALITY PROTEIN: hypothetical protein MAR_035881 [Mya arenaria]
MGGYIDGSCQATRRTLSSEEIHDMTWEGTFPPQSTKFVHRCYSVTCQASCKSHNILILILSYIISTTWISHGHAILWVEDAPQPNDSSENICLFVDLYIQANLPRDDENWPTLSEMFRHTTIQQLVQNEVVLVDLIFLSQFQKLQFCHEPDENGDRKRRAAIEILTKVKECLQEDDCDNDSLSVKDLLVKCTISDEALQYATKSPTIFLKRDQSETCINNYNPNILRLWKENTY